MTAALPLICHSSTPCLGIRGVTVHAGRSGDGLLVFHYQVQGDIDRLRLPAQSDPRHTDGLWQHTCFEAFVRVPKTSAYFELNFSPSREWAAYRFDDYRQGMAAVPAAQEPRIVCRRREDCFEADVEVALPSFAGNSAELLLAVSAVLETRERRLSYWALAHPAGKPDFHHPDAFTLSLPPHAGDAR